MNVQKLHLIYFSPTQTTKKVLKEKVGKVDSIDSMPLPKFPGNYPYRKPHSLKDISPVTLEERCTRCETCVSVCPTAAIVLKDKVATDAGTCIVCCACVKNCPTEARLMKDPYILSIAEWLWENYNKRKEPEMFLG